MASASSLSQTDIPLFSSTWHVAAVCCGGKHSLSVTWIIFLSFYLCQSLALSIAVKVELVNWREVYIYTCEVYLILSSYSSKITGMERSKIQTLGKSLELTQREGFHSRWRDRIYKRLKFHRAVKISRARNNGSWNFASVTWAFLFSLVLFLSTCRHHGAAGWRFLSCPRKLAPARSRTTNTNLAIWPRQKFPPRKSRRPSLSRVCWICSRSSNGNHLSRINVDYCNGKCFTIFLESFFLRFNSFSISQRFVGIFFKKYSVINHGVRVSFHRIESVQNSNCR